MDLLINFIFALIFSGACAYLAQQKNRNPTVWFILGLFFTFISLLVILFLPDLEPETEQRRPVEEPEAIEVSGAPVSEASWYYLDKDRQQHGPVDMLALQALWQTNTLQATSFVWSDGMEEWKELHEVPELVELLGRE